jgi:hypothetical protein
MEKLTQESVDKAVEMIKELGVSDATVETVKKELEAKVEGSGEPKANPVDDAEDKEMEYSFGKEGKDVL